MSRDHYKVLEHVLHGTALEGVKVQYLFDFDPAPGWAVEFGVWTGTSLGMIAERMPVIGFDSFEGLPEDWREGFPKGHFAYPELVPFPYHPNAMIVPGLFEDTLPTFPFPALSLVHIDCDLYSSTVTALAYTARHMQVGTIVVFDEYHGYDGWEWHEAKAWTEFVNRYDVDADLVASGEQAQAFVITGLGGFWS